MNKVLHPFREKVMFKQFNRFPFFSPEDSSAGVVNESTESIINFLDEEDDDKAEVIDLDEPKSKEIKEESREEDEEPEEKEELEDEIEDELTPPTEEQLELVTPVRRKEILAKYPKLFKEFPYLEKAYYREQQFTEVFPTINDAKEANNKSQVLDNLERDLMEGNTEKLLLAAKNEGGRAFNKIVDNYLSTLSKVDEKAYHHVIGNTIKHTIIAMVTESRRSQNDVLQNAAAILNQFVFGSSNFEQPTNLTVEEKTDPKLDEISRRERSLINQKFETANGELHSRVNNAFRATIEANIDPKQSMTEYVRRNASREALESLESAINTDSRFRGIIDKLWENAVKNDFRKESVDKIRSAFLSKGKILLPSVIKKARNEALKGTGKRVTEETDEPKNKITRSESSHSKSTSDNRKGPKEGQSAMDYLMSDD